MHTHTPRHRERGEERTRTVPVSLVPIRRLRSLPHLAGPQTVHKVATKSLRADSSFCSQSAAAVTTTFQMSCKVTGSSSLFLLGLGVRVGDSANTFTAGLRRGPLSLRFKAGRLKEPEGTM